MADKLFTKEERLLYAYTYISYQSKDLLLDFWQDAYIRSYARFIAIVKSRRVGWSFICSLKGLIKAMDPARVGYTKQFVSYNEEDAIEKINYARQFYESIPDCDAKKPLITGNKTTLEFQDKNGITVSRLISIPCRPPRGKGGDISLDEYAIYLPKMQKLIYDAALPVISRGGTVEMGSSPLGKIGQFYDIMTDRTTYDYERYNIPWWFCRDLCTDVPTAIKIAPNMTTSERVETFGTKIIQLIYKNTDFDTFTQEYECTFIDSSESYITLDLIFENTPGKRESDLDLSLCEKMTDEEYWEYNRSIDFQSYKDIDAAILNYNPDYHGETLFLGFDVGRYHDATAIYILGMKKNKKRGFARIELKGKTFKEQEELILKIYKELPIFKGAIDDTGMGKDLGERLASKLGDRIIRVTFSQEMKEILAIEVKKGLENKEFLLENDKDFHQQIHSIKRITTGGKHFKYDAARNEKGHSDSFWAWALANYATKESQELGFYEKRALKKNQEHNQEIIKTQKVEIKKGKTLSQINKMFGY